METANHDLNYRHLHYFWVVAREGGLVLAGKALRLSHPTLSAQIRLLEEQLGEKLFFKQGRRLALTEGGRIVFQYAEQIFGLGREMIEIVKGGSGGSCPTLQVGAVDALPKMIVRRLVAPALALPERIRLVCREDNFERLLAELALHKLDVVLADAPLPPGSGFRGYSHFLGQSGVSFFASKGAAARYRANFPRSLNDAPMLLPLEGLSLRRQLDHWLERLALRPVVTAEFQDSALLKALGSDGLGVFPAPQAIEREVAAQYRVEKIGTAEGVYERFYAITAERRIRHPAVTAIADLAREDLFRAPQ